MLTPADESHHIDKHKFTVPFVCGSRDLGEALRRIGEGAAMIRTKGQAGTGENSPSQYLKNKIMTFKTICMKKMLQDCAHSTLYRNIL